MFGERMGQEVLGERDLQTICANFGILFSGSCNSVYKSIVGMRKLRSKGGEKKNDIYLHVALSWNP